MGQGGDCSTFLLFADDGASLFVSQVHSSTQTANESSVAACVAIELSRTVFPILLLSALR
jgi:hypothetical protein